VLIPVSYQHLPSSRGSAAGPPQTPVWPRQAQSRAAVLTLTGTCSHSLVTHTKGRKRRAQQLNPNHHPKFNPLASTSPFLAPPSQQPHHIITAPKDCRTRAFHLTFAIPLSGDSLARSPSLETYGWHGERDNRTRTEKNHKKPESTSVYRRDPNTTAHSFFLPLSALFIIIIIIIIISAYALLLPSSSFPLILPLPSFCQQFRRPRSPLESRGFSRDTRLITLLATLPAR